MKMKFSTRDLHVSFLAFVVIFLGRAGFASDFGVDVPCQDAVPVFLNAVTEATAGAMTESELRGVERWESDTRGGFPGFLDDWIGVMAGSETGSAQEIFGDYSTVNQKWQAVIDSFPGSSELFAVLDPLWVELFLGVPGLRPARPDDVPLQNLFELYQQLEALNPWGTAAFYQILPLEAVYRQVWLRQVTRERTLAGYWENHIIRRETLILENGMAQYFEVIENDQVVQKFIIRKEPTFAHEIVRRAIQGGVDQDLRDFLIRYIRFVDQELVKARDSGLLEPQLYNITYGIDCEVYEDIGCHLPSWIHRIVLGIRRIPFLVDKQANATLSAAVERVAFTPPPFSGEDALLVRYGEERRIRIVDQQPSQSETRLNKLLLTLAVSSSTWLAVVAHKGLSLYV